MQKTSSGGSYNALYKPLQARRASFEGWDGPRVIRRKIVALRPSWCDVIY